MNNGIKEFIKTAQKVRLSREEKTAMRGALLRYAKEHPAKSGVMYRSVVSPFSLADIRGKKIASGIAIGALLFGGSTSFAAEGALPGDVLYPVKTHVNEPVRGAVAFSPQAKAAWEVRLVERRLEEVEKLAVTPEVLPEVKGVMQANIKQYTDQVHQRIAAFDKDGDEEDAIQTAGNFSTMLREHENTIATLAAQAPVVSRVETALGSSATSTTSSVVTPTIDSSATSTIPVATHREDALVEVLNDLRAVRGHAEERHHELEHKYHPETQESSVNDSSDDQPNDEADTINEVPSVTTPHTERPFQIVSKESLHRGAPSSVVVASSTPVVAATSTGGMGMTNIIPTITNFLSGYKNDHREEIRTKANDNPELRGRSGERQKEAHRGGENSSE